ncbi:tumor protein p53-inducible protein 13 [Mantella aurantiaca]
MWRLCALCSLLLVPVHVRSSVCDNGQSNIQLDLPDESVYSCHGDYIPPSSEVYPSIATKYKEEETYHACMDVVINHKAPIPNSGAHRPIGAKYGEYTYCPPQRWLHNLQHAGVGFLYHPCVDSQRKEALSFVARRCVPRHIITPLPSLSRERPIALATWCATLEMSHLNITEMRYWLKENVVHESPFETVQDGAYQHLLSRSSAISIDSTYLCHERDFQMLNYFMNLRGRLLRIRRRAALLSTPVVQDMASSHVSATISSSTLAEQHIEKSTKIHNTVTQPTRTVGLSATKSFSSTSSVGLAQDLDHQGIKGDVHSRETKKNDQAELPVQKIMPTPGNQSLITPYVNVTQPVGSNISQETGKEQSSHKDQPADSLQKEMSKKVEHRAETTQQSPHQISGLKLSPTSAEMKPLDGQKLDCSCTGESSAKAQKRLGNSQQKSNEGFVSTPRTQEATWAAASLICLFSLLIFSVLYTQIYKKFRRSQSLYWSSGSYSEEKESVASIIKRRLVQGHSRRKKWFGKKKSPTVLYESLSESSD